MAVIKRKDIFPFGTHFYREPALPLKELKRDMRIMKKLGFNTLKIQESWAIDNPREGEINLSTMEELIAEANQLNLYIYFGITMEQMPAWVWKKYPDCRLVNAFGEPHNDSTQYLIPADGKPGPCWDHPGARETTEKFMAKLARSLGRFDNIIVWNCWQEVGFWPGRPGATSDAEVMFCYCSYTLERFRQWLRKKYGNLETLNKVWRTGFGEWDEVEPPRMYMAVPSFIDWRTFMDEVYLAGVVRWKADILRRNDPKHRPVMCHVGRPTIGSGIDWHLAKAVDLFGTSSYPAWHIWNDFGSWDAEKPKFDQPVAKSNRLRWEMWTLSLCFDYIRSAAGRDREFCIAEFQGGPAVSYLWKGITPTPSDIRFWTILALSCGTTGITFWNHRPEIFWTEGHGFGLCDSKGKPTDRVKEAGKIGQTLQNYSLLFREGVIPPRQVAIIINEDLYHFSQATPKAREHLIHTIRGLYKCLWQAGVWVDFVEAEEVDKGVLNNYKVATLPFPLAISDSLVEALSDYVEQGGVLISEACAGRYNKYGFANLNGLNPLMEKLCGAREKDVLMCKEWGEEKYWTPPEGRAGELVGPVLLEGTGPLNDHNIQANVYVETLTPSQSKPILLWQKEVTGVVNSYGKGKVYLIGTFLGHAVATYEDSNTRNFLLRILKDAGVSTELYGKLLRRRRLTDDQEAWFLFNLSEKTLTEFCDVGGFSRAKGLLGKEMQIKNGKLEISVEPLSVRCIVLDKNRT